MLYDKRKSSLKDKIELQEALSKDITSPVKKVGIKKTIKKKK